MKIAPVPVGPNEPPRDKTNKVSVRPAKTQISLGIRPVWSVFAVRMKKAWTLSYPLSAQRRLWSDWADAQADLSLRWAHSHIVGFATGRLKCHFELIGKVTLDFIVSMAVGLRLIK